MAANSGGEAGVGVAKHVPLCHLDRSEAEWRDLWRNGW
jgi:hypothetical protein